ncbi:MAG: SDR family oxidoreductase [Alphaproteobacteria bacterium]|nr:SDR family oxidoreductase [Alphaproteobacteria bacterium]
MDCRMDGRTALITGASTGLGLAMALEFAAAGARVLMLARRADRLEQARAEVAAAGGQAEAFPCDVASAADIARTWQQISARQDARVDILVNNAGKATARPFEQVSDEEWQADLDLKLFAAIRLARLALPGMKARRFGRIVNVLNIHAKAPGPNTAPTSVARAAGLALTKVLAQEGAPHNVLVNALLVGFIESDQWARRHAASGSTQPYREFLDTMARERRVPLGRVGEAAEFARVATFLCSDAGSYVTGTAINVDGGLSPIP